MCKILVWMRALFERILEFTFSLYWEGQKKAIPPLGQSHAMLADSAVTLARKIKNKELKSEDLVRAVIERMKEVNPIVNAIAEERFTLALAEAKEVDRLINAGLSEEDAKKPFLGVPFTTKESQAITGMKLTMGLLSRKDVVTAEDSRAVVLLKEAGAIPLATTNLPELLIWQETRNLVYGRTNNPHHTGRSPGGSSGAEAALTACYATPISLCSDIGGSTRMPAFYCGMFGHHPTAGTTNLKGVYFRNGDEKDSMFALGFISKHVEDLGPLITVIADEKAKDLNLDRIVNVKDIKFYYIESADDIYLSPVSTDLRNAMNKVVSNISKNVTKTDQVPQPYNHEGFRYMYRLWLSAMDREPDNYVAMYHNFQKSASAFVEVLKKLFFLSKHSWFSIIRLVELQWLPKVNAEWSEKLTAELRDDLIHKLGDNGVLLMPSAPLTAPYHYSCLLRPFNFCYFSIVNALKFPATQVPLGVDSQGLPLGIQVMSTPNNDALCLSVARYLETQFGGSVMACK